jgi:hypothetical protein
MFHLFKLFQKPRSSRSSSRRERTVPPRLELLESRAVPATFVVTNVSGSAAVAGSLAYDVAAANATPGLNYIDFDIPPSMANSNGQFVISLNQTLYLTNQVVIDGTTQPGYFPGNPVVLIQGNGTLASLFQLQSSAVGVTTYESTIQGLDLFGYSVSAITILNSSQFNFIQNNDIGFFTYFNTTFFEYTASLNSQQVGNSFSFGVQVESSFNTIRSNTISGNANGILVGENPLETWSGAFYQTNSIQFNSIGTNVAATSTANFGNTADGILVGSGARQNFLGPTNVISGNQGNGVEFAAPSNTGNVAFSNFIGTTNNGGFGPGNGAALGNGGVGVLMGGGASGNEVGGPFGGNYIDDNAAGGIFLGTGNSFGYANRNFVQYNIIGLNAFQTSVVGTQYLGIYLASLSTGNLVNGNVIAGASVNGILVNGANGNAINQNWIGENASGVGTGFANGGYGIAFIGGASENLFQGNALGVNPLGSFYF